MIDFSKPFCTARYPIYSPWGRTYPRCAKPEGHDGPHQLSYGTEFTDEEKLGAATIGMQDRLRERQQNSIPKGTK